MTKLELVEEAVKEWADGVLTADQAMWNIHTVIHSRAMTKDEMAKAVELLDLDKPIIMEMD